MSTILEHIMRTSVNMEDTLGTDLATIDLDTASYEELAELSGQSFGDTSDYTEDTFLKASINLERKINDKSVPNPSYQMYADGTPTFLTDDVKFVFLGKRYMFRVWDAEQKAHSIQTVMSEEYRNRDLMDTAGGFNAGNRGYIPKDVYETLSDAERKRHTDAKRTLVIYALVRGKGKTLEGEPVDLDEWTPIRLFVSRSVAEYYEKVFKDFNRTKTPAFLKEVNLAELDVGKAGSFDIGVPKFAINEESSVDIASITSAMKDMVADIDSHNEWVQTEHMKAHREDSRQAQDVAFIEVLNEEDE